MITYAQKLRSLRQAEAPRPVPRLVPTPAVPERVESRVLALLATTLGVDPVGVSAGTPFAELGLSSLLGVRFLDAVNRAFGLRLGVEVLFGAGSVTALAAHVARLVPAEAPALREVAAAEEAPAVASVPAPAPAVAPALAVGDIAIIGMAGRFPGAPDLDSFWRALAAGECLVSEVPAERWAAATFYDPDPAAAGRTISKWAGFLDGIDRFDAGFFNISPREAAAMDPQHRLFLEQAWLAFENAGYATDRLKGSATGVFVGASNSGYDALLEPDAKAAQSYGLTGNLVSLLASRISYFLDLRGPALVVDTACSASLVALDLACQALRRGEIGMALVGGVSLFLDEKPFVAMTRTGMLSPDGRCHTFDAAANGIVVGEAVAAIVLKPLAQALADGDRIDAVIKATGTNQDGRSNGITAPNPDAQTALLRAVHAQAGIDPATLTYIEAHGTGTPLGDPIEIAALRTALGDRPADALPCGLGSVKSNIGHTAEAAGLAGLMKTVLCLRHGELVPSVNFDTLNPKIDVAASGLSVITERRPWRTMAGVPRRAGVSAFGLSGTNAHVVVEEPPSPPLRIADGAPQLLLLSARDADGLSRRAADLAVWLRGTGEALADVAATLGLARTHFDHRLALVVGSVADAADRLDRGDWLSGVVRGGAGTRGPASEDLDRLAERYVGGEAPEWPHVWAGQHRPLPLPHYPFTRAVHWAARRPTPAAHPFARVGDDGVVSHRFIATDPIARDHVIGGVPLLHASVFLEMARFAAAQRGNGTVRGLRDVAWAQTISVPPDGIDVRIKVDGAACAMLAGTSDTPTARCVAVFDCGAEPPPIDVAAVKAETDQHASRKELDALDRGAVRLGPSFAGFDEIWVGDGVGLAWVGPSGPDDGCGLSPRLMDAAIQTGASLLARGDGATPRLRYPTGVAAIDILTPPPSTGCFILARRTGADRVDLTIADAAGKPAIHWTGFQMRGAAASRAAEPEAAAPRSFRPVWVQRAADAGSANEPDMVVGAESLVRLLGQTGAALADGSRIVFCDAGTGDTAGLLRLVRDLAARGLGNATLELRVVTTCAQTVTGSESAVHPAGATVQGLGKAIGREFPSWRVVILDIDPAEWIPALRQAVLSASPSPSGEVVALRGGVRFDRVLEPIADASAGAALRDGGVYLLVGGMGRVGRDVARYLASRHRARLFLVGRQPLDADRRAFLDELRALGAEAEYRATDITTADGATSALTAVRTMFGTVNGVIQAVFDPLFAPLERTEDAAFAAAMRPKVEGLTALSAATADDALDLFAVFSSIGAFAAFPGNVGQASYCAACSFEAAFAERQRALGRPFRLIQWGLWENEAFVGEGLQRLRRQGIHPMVAADAVEAFAEALSGPDAQIVHASLSPQVWRAMGAPSDAGSVHAAAAAALPLAGRGAEAVDATLHLAVDAHARHRMAEVLRERGMPLGGEALAERRTVLPRHARLFDAVVDLLGRNTGSAPSRDELLARAPSLRDPLALLDLCVAALPDVIAGEREGTDVMFPGGSMRLVEAIYREQPVLAACNASVAAAIASARPHRVLEVGAGTGATADAVLLALGDRSDLEYHYTDVSTGFVRHARARYSDPRMRFAVLDIEKDPANQGVDPASFDVVVATNVLHATRDIQETLRHIAGMLRPGGLLLINEMTVAEDFATLTFGLLDGWWRAADPARRLPHSPLLDVPGWRRNLLAAGFAHVVASPAPGFPDVAGSPQVVLLAERQGAVAAQPMQTATPHASTAPRPVIGDFEALVRDRVAAGLDLPADAIDAETPFGELGVDSIVAPQIAEDLNRTAGISLRSTDLYNFATVRALADHIATTFPDARVTTASDDQVALREEEQAKGHTPPETVAIAASRPRAQAVHGAPGGTVMAEGRAALDQSIAIIGMAGRFPDAPDVEAFWRNILAGHSAVREIDRFDMAPYYAAERGQPGKSYARWAATLADHDRFDPLFFAISPAEAEAMDPQQRLLLEEAWHALESAGTTPAQLDGLRCGVFVGASANSYAAPTTPSLQTLGGSMAILSARLSYFLNLKGPTFPVDTGCSSSLVALHLACQSLRTGETDMALAAGVSCNLLSPPIFFYLSDAGMASPNGRCATFDDAADGFAPGEGVGVVVLKRLADALRDGDRVLAVVRGTGINQDGKTSGLTAPSATSQTELEREVYRRSDIDPRHIGLIEAHGTGTRLGDPIEVAALTDAFASFTPDKGFCAIGSVKTNIGHAMAAAGIAGLVKAVQAVRHAVLPPTLHFTSPNRHIDFANSPFVVNTTARPWVSDRPRMAAVSSFGFSGTNAHVVIEQSPPARTELASPGPFLFVLSGRTEAAVGRRIDDLLTWLREHPEAPAADIAYTLAARRTHFRHRRAFVAETVAELVICLSGGTVSAPPDLEAMARRYMAGEALDFTSMLGNLIDLPGYPFERERFWNPVDATPAPAHASTPASAQAPAHGSGDLLAPWLTHDHVINGRRLLPGAAFLELARATALGSDSSCLIRDVVWSAPVDATDGDPRVTVAVEPEGGAFRCSLRSSRTEHAFGVIASGGVGTVPPLDINAVSARCGTSLAGSAVYETAHDHGFVYGPGFRVVQQVRIGREEALAWLAPPIGVDGAWVLHPGLLDGVFQTAACIGLADPTATRSAFVPFALGSFTSFAPLRGPCVVHARVTVRTPGLIVFDIDVAGLDGTMLATCRGLQARALSAPAEVGTVMMTPVWRPSPIGGTTSGEALLIGASDGLFGRLRPLLPGRRLVQIRAGSAFQRHTADCFSIDPTSADDHRRLLAEASPGAGAAMALLWDLDAEAPVAGTSLASAVATMDPETGSRSLFLAAQAALLAPEAGVTRLLHATRSGPTQSAVAGLARTVRLESSRLRCVAVGLDRIDPAAIAAELCATQDGPSVTYRDGTRLTQVLEPWAAPDPLPVFPLAPGQTCLITGGAGAIGLAIARHLARTIQPRLILLGRSALTPEIERALAAIEAEGADVLYLSADVISGASLRAALDKARRRFGPIHGVIHAAGVLRDGRITQTDGAGFDAVLAPKLLGALTLDHLTQQDPLAFFALFSSTAAAFGSAGQAAYAAGNGFLDGFAAWRTTQQRPGRSVSIAWPLWETGGMAPPPEVAAELERRMGMTPMPDMAAMAVLDAALATGPAGVVALHGRTAALRAFVGDSGPPKPVTAATAPVGGAAACVPDAADLRPQVETYLKSVLSEVTRLAESRIEADERFEAYGVDSMMIVRMNTRMEQDLGDLPKTLFFEYQTVSDLAACLIQAHPDVVARRFAPVVPVPAEPVSYKVFDIPGSAVTRGVVSAANTAEPMQPPAEQGAFSPRPVPAIDNNAIAIIGISGIYPMASDLDQFWRNLAAGRDCIVEIPADRWPLDGFYDPDRDRPETSYTKWGGFIDGVEMFDPRFFNISPREADALDPQARKFLEVAWATMEDAGLTRETLFRGDPEPSQRLAGVFVGVMYGDYQLFGAEEAVRGNLIAPNAAYWNVANRVSHFLDLHGPSMAVDTACSSSLTAVHMACLALRAGDCSIAFAGGVNLTVHPGKHWILSKSGFASSDGRCRSFGEGGDGYVPGEGVGAVLLKPLARALADGDRIHAVIRSSALNHGGRTNGYTVPNPVAQGSLISAALRRGGVDPASIGYVEAHGTGTSLGDPVEIAGLGRAFAGVGPGVCPIGSVKSNIGHLESAAGIAALTKVVLQLQHQALVPSLHASALNPNLNLATTPFRVQQDLAPWPRRANRVRRAGISSFGAGGANGHLVVEEAPDLPAEPMAPVEPLIVPLSAATAEALAEQATRLADWRAGQGGDVDFPAVVRTLQVGREAMRHRWAVRVSTSDALIAALRAFAAGQGSADPSLADWTSGGRMDWDTVAPGPRRPVSVPTYAFARRPCWVTVTPRGTLMRAVALDAPSVIPLACDPRTPDVTDHRLGGQVMLAGAFLLDAVRAQATRLLRQDVAGMADIRFLRPVTPDMAAELVIEPDHRFAIRVGTLDHVTGRLLRDAPDDARPDADLPSIASRCREALDQTMIYGALASGGAEYGTAYRLLDTVWRGDGEALGELMPVPERDGWPPGLLDAAFQLSFALATGAGGLAPFTIDRLTLLGSLPDATHVVGIRREAGPGFLQLDLCLTDAGGRVVLAVDGFVAKAATPRAEASAPVPLRLLRPIWTKTRIGPLPIPVGQTAIIGHAADGGLGDRLCDAAGGRQGDPKSADHVWYLGGWRSALGETEAVSALAALVRDLSARPTPPTLTVVVSHASSVMTEAPDPVAAAVAAFAKSVGREHPDLRVRVIDADPGVDATDLLRVPSDASEIAWRSGEAWTRALGETTLPEAASPWRKGGVYLIAGGAGGIGLALATHLVQSAQARVVLLGRRPADAALRARIDQIGGEVLYLTADVTDANAVATAVGIAQARFGAINGAFHLALAMHDARAVTLTEADIRSVMAPKTDGTRNLMAALADQALDFLMLFSSSNAHTTNPGQSAYAAASAAQDAIGLGRAPWPVKIIDWGFWGEVGRVATDAYRASLARIGVYPISTREGMETVERMLAAPLRQIVPLRISDAVAAALGVVSAGASGTPASGTRASVTEAVARAVAPRARAGLPMLERATGAFTAIDAYAAGLLLLAWQELGALREPGGHLSPDGLERLGIQPRFRRLVAAQSDMLVRAGFLIPDGAGWIVGEPVRQPASSRRAALAERRAGWIADQPDVAPYLDLLDTCSAALPDILRGQVDANDVLFPGGSSARVEPIYRGNQVVDHFQAIVAEAATAAVAERLASSRSEIRILEIGAGTGGTTAFVLPALSEHAARVRYVFSDIGRFFLDAAGKRFAGYPFLSTALLDIENPPAAQGFEPNSFDIVIAANVLHATRDIRATLGHVRSLMRPGGLLLVNEATMRQDFNTMTFGLTRGWWAFEDTARRIDHAPLLRTGTWLSELAHQGFLGAHVLAGGEGTLQTVIAAEGDGAAPVVARPTAQPTPVGDRRIEDILRDTVAKSLRLRPEEVDPETSFAEFGADSIISVDLVREINAALGIELKTTALFNYATVRALAGYIETEFAAQLGVAREEAAGKGSRIRERSERLREIIRKRRESMGQPMPAEPERQESERTADPPPQNDNAALLQVLRRLQAGEIGVTQALAEAGE